MLFSGAGAVDAGKLVVGELKSDSEGAGDHLFNATRNAAVTARGVGKTVVLGHPTCTVRHVGSGTDRKSVGQGKSVAVRVDHGGSSMIKKKKNNKKQTNET